VSSVEDLAELSDASVSRLRRIEYKIPEDSTGVEESLSIGESNDVLESLVALDEVFVNKNNLSTIETVQTQETISTVTLNEDEAAWENTNINWDFFEWAKDEPDQFDDLTENIVELMNTDDSITRIEKPTNSMSWGSVDTNWNFDEWTQ
jgi:hypothetical protein